MSSVCRVCLSGNTRLHSLENNPLINIYEKLSNAKINSEDARPRLLCYVCYRNLLRCHTFSQMACRSEEIFSKLFHKGLEPAHDYITDADRRIQQHLSIATMQFGTIDGKATYVGSQVKDEGIAYYDIGEELNAGQYNFMAVPDNFMISQSRLKENQIDEGNQVNIKVGPIQSIDLKGEDKLVDVESVPEDSFKSQLKVEEEKGHQGNELGMDELLYNICVEQTKPGTSKQQFSKESILSSHIRISHVQQKEKQNTRKTMTKDTTIPNQKNIRVCHLCYKQFNRKCHLDDHMSIHTGEKPFACNVCHKQFRQKKTLVAHMKTHTGKKPFACNICDKQFNRKDHLADHMLLHTGEKMLDSNVCDKPFRR